MRASWPHFEGNKGGLVGREWRENSVFFFCAEKTLSYSLDVLLYVPRPQVFISVLQLQVVVGFGHVSFYFQFSAAARVLLVRGKSECAITSYAMSTMTARQDAATTLTSPPPPEPARTANTGYMEGRYACM